MPKLALLGQVLHELFKKDQPINMKDSLADPRAFSHPAQAREKVLGTRLLYLSILHPFFFFFHGIRFFVKIIIRIIR